VTQHEYESLQNQLSALMEPGKLFHKGYRHRKGQEIYRNAILAAKSVLKKHYEQSKEGRQE